MDEIAVHRGVNTRIISYFCTVPITTFHAFKLWTLVVTFIKFKISET